MDLASVDARQTLGVGVFDQKVLPLFVWKRLILVAPNLFCHTRYIYRILVASLTKLGSRWSITMWK